MVNAAAIANLYRRSSFCTLTLATIFPAESNGRAEGRGRARRALACAHTRRKLCFESLETHCSHEISHRRRFCIDHIVRGDRDTENVDLVQIHPVYRPVDFNMDQNLYVESNFVQPKLFLKDINSRCLYPACVVITRFGIKSYLSGRKRGLILARLQFHALNTCAFVLPRKTN